MYLRTSKQRSSTGRVIESLQIVESVWDPQRRRSVVKVIYNCGSAHDDRNRDKLKRLAKGILRRMSPEEMANGSPGVRLVQAWPYGELYVLEKLWEQIGIKEILPSLTRDATRQKLPVERACFAMVANRCLAPSSKLYCFEQWLREVRIDDADGLELHHLYRSMDYFAAHKDDIERALYFKVADLFSADVDLVFYHTTTLHCEIDEEDADGEDDVMVRGSQLAGGKEYEALRQRSRSSKNKRSDLPQIVVGLAMTRDGLPIRSWVFRGDTVDVETIAKVKEDLRGWKLTRSIFVGDAGMVSEKNLKALSAGGGKYILCVPMGRGDDVTKWVLTNPGRYKKVADNLHVKEVVLGDGEARRRYVVCYNPQEAERQRKHRQKVLAELKEMLPRLRCKHDDDATHSKRVCQLRACERFGKYLKYDEGRLRIDQDKVRHAESLDGKYVVHSNDDTLSSEDMALGYKQLMQVEQAWRLLKSGTRIRPSCCRDEVDGIHSRRRGAGRPPLVERHWVPHRICAHVSLTMIALLLERLAEKACGDTWRNIRDDLRQIQLGQLSGPNGEIWQVTEPSQSALNRLNKLKIPPPPGLFQAG